MKLKGVLLILLAFFMPLSVFVADIVVFLCVAVWVLEGDLIIKWNKIISSQWLLSLIFLITLYFLGLLWGTHHQQAGWIIQKTLLLLLLPILYTFDFNQNQIKLSVYAFLSSTTLTAIIAILINLGCIKHLFKYSSVFNKNWNNPAVMAYTDHNMFLSFVILICLLMLLNNFKNLRYLIMLSFILITSIFSIYGEMGRSGIITFICISILFILLVFRKNMFKMMICFIVIIVVNGLAFLFSDTFKNRIETTQLQLEKLDKKYKNSINTRYFLYQYTFEKIKEKPILGYGTGSFFQEISSISDHAKIILNNQHRTPHNNFLFLWFELGFIGLIVLVFMFFFQLKAYHNLNQGYFRMIFPIVFFISMFFDTYLQNHNTTLLYCYLSYICYSYSFK